MSWYFAASAALSPPPMLLGRPISLRPILRIVPAFFCGADCIITCAAPDLASDADGRACSGGGPGGGAGGAHGSGALKGAGRMNAASERVMRAFITDMTNTYDQKTNVSDFLGPGQGAVKSQDQKTTF